MRMAGRRRRMMMRRRRRRRIILAGGLIAFGAHKLSKKDVDRVEEHTGMDAEELTDEELEQAMDELGIEDQDSVSSDAAAGDPDYLNELERLGQLHEQGVITDEEFEMKKKQLLGL